MNGRLFGRPNIWAFKEAARSMALRSEVGRCVYTRPFSQSDDIRNKRMVPKLLIEKPYQPLNHQSTLSVVMCRYLAGQSHLHEVIL